MASTAEHLQALGMTEWEAKAYLALLDEAPLSGYAVAKNSGVPRAKVYEVLASLVDKGVVHLARGEPTLYGALPPKELVARLREDFSQKLDDADQALAQYAETVDANAVIWDIKGRSAIVQRARQLVGSARRSVLVEIWQADAPELHDALLAASQRGVKITVVAYGDPGYAFADVHLHPSTDEVTRGLGGRWLVVSVDDHEIVAGNVSAGSMSRAAWTSHPGLAVPITELIIHDLYKLEMLAAHQQALEATFGPGLSELREKYGRADHRISPS
ncbi:TrmB family transcriptional regulator [Actinomyces oricola]|uniref:TrmB family transcriptional regulator n=1 Tax=Actinomyces oricola TaxID=206043 RepID=UPI000FFECEC2|nr:TrmB family transcriptional regulator [Actinomyces oricola]